MLVGRGAERAHLDGLLADARQGRRGSALVLRGEPGIGKTALLDYAAQQADEFLVLRAGGVESESELAFASLHELLQPLLWQLDALPEVQRRALQRAFALTDEEYVDPFAAYVGTLGLLAEAASEQPVLCLVDDAQWIDSESAGAISFAGRRLQYDRIVILLAAREPDRRGFEAPGLPGIVLSGLQPAAAEALLDQHPRLAPEERARVLETAAGNPLALLELPMAMRQAISQPARTESAPVPVSRRLETAFLGRLSGLSTRAQQAALLLAAIDTSDPRVLSTALAELGLGGAPVEELEAAGLTTIDSGRPILTHPLIRSAVYQAASPVNRRRVHSTLATALRRAGDQERFAWHLAAAARTADEEVASELEIAAGLLRQRGSVSAAARALERAARLSPDPVARARRLVAAARAHRAAGRAGEVEELIHEALAMPHDEQTWADAQALLAEVNYWFGRPDESLGHLEALARVDRRAGAAVLVTAAMGYGSVDLQRALAYTDRALNLDPGNLMAASARAEYLSRLGRTTEAETAARSVARASKAASDWYNASEAAVVLGGLERYEDARRLAGESIGRLRAQGALKQLSHALCAYTQIETRAGNLKSAYEAGLGSLDLAESTAEPLQIAFAASFLAACEAWLGLDSATRQHAARAMAAMPGESVRTTLEARAALGLLELQLGHAEQAVSELEPVVVALRSLSIVNPGYVQAAPEYVEALARSGRHDQARAALAGLERQSYSANRLWAVAATERCRLLLASEVELDACYARAMEWHARADRPLETARTKLAYGERLRRAGRRLEARRQLRAALEIFEQASARLFAERAHRELAATGERLRRKRDQREALSAQELQVALAVARGATNKQAASELFLSPKTIEFHLRNVYQKLGITSRTQLVNALHGRPQGGSQLSS